MLKLAPDTADFGSVVTGQSSTVTMFTVANVGEGDTGSISAAISGSQGSNFTIDGTTCTSLPKAATCTISVRFAPNALGTKVANLAVTSSPGGTVMASLQGTGIMPGALTITPSTSQFSSVVVGQSGTTTTFTVKNTGAASTGALTTTSGGANAGEFNKVSDTCNGQMLAAAASCTIVVGFSPLTSGPKFASYSVTGTPGGTVSAAINGLALDNAQLFLNPTSQNFGSVVTGSSSANVAFTLVNIGGVPTGAITQTLTGVGVASYTIVSSTCASTVLNPGASCTVTVRFNPTAAGTATAALTLSSTTGGTQTANLTAIGVAPGSIQMLPSLKAFANTTVGQSSATQDFVVTNTGGVMTGPINTSLSGQDATQFFVTSNGCLGVSLAPNGTCTITARFAPTTAGAAQALLAATASPGGSTSSALSGNGIPVAALSISPSSHDFGSVGVGEVTGVQAFTIQNVGGSATGVPTVSVTGPNPNQFSFTSGCTTALQPLQTCTVSVRFAPTTIGSDVATLDVSASPGSTVSANLFGQGTNPAALTVNPSSITFPGVTTIGDTSATTPQFIVTNNGASTTGPLVLTLQGANPGDFTVVSDTCGGVSLQAAKTCAVSVRFAPTARGDRTATVNVAGMPGGSVNVALAGTALPRIEVIAINTKALFANPFDFGTVTVKTVQPQQVRITVQNNTNANHVLITTLANNAGGDFVFNGESCFNNSAFTAPKHTAFGAPPTGTIFAHSTCNVFFQFIPQSAGPKTAQAVFSIGPTVLDQATENLVGNGVDGMYWTFTPGGAPASSFDFGNVARGSTSPTKRVFLYNRPDAPTTGPVQLGVFQFAQFNGTTTCFGAQIPANGTCFVDLFFQPTINGPDHATLSATATPGGTSVFDYRGTGVDPSGLIINPTPVDFGDVFDGKTSTIAVTVQNPAGAQTSGNFTFSLQNDSCTGGGSGSGSGSFGPCFSIASGNVGDCVQGAPIANGQSCVIRITYASNNQIGGKSATLVTNANPGLPNGTKSINVTANDRSEISITPTAANLGGGAPVQAGSVVTQTFTVRNDSSIPVTLGQRFLFGQAPEVTAISDSCAGAMLVAGVACTVTLSFAPTNTESVNATLEYDTTDGHGVADAQVTATAQAPDVEFTESFSSTTPLSMNQQASHVFTLMNSGAGPGVVAAVQVNGDPTDFKITADGCTGVTLPNNGTCTVTLSYANASTCPQNGFHQASLSASVPHDPNGVQSVFASAFCAP